MTDKLKAQVSAFVDDELLDAESELLVRRLCSDDDLRQTAARYTLIGDAMRGSLHEIRADLAGNIMQVIENEPLVEAAPVAAASSWRRLLGGGVLAATVAAVAVFSLRPSQAPDAVPGPAIASEEPGIVVPGDKEGAAAFQPLTAPVMRQAGSQTQLDRYLLRHNQFATTTGRQGVLNYRSLDVEGEIDAAEPKSPEDAAGDKEAANP